MVEESGGSETKRESYASSEVWERQGATKDGPGEIQAQGTATRAKESAAGE